MKRRETLTVWSSNFLMLQWLEHSLLSFFIVFLETFSDYNPQPVHPPFLLPLPQLLPSFRFLVVISPPFPFCFFFLFFLPSLIFKPKALFLVLHQPHLPSWLSLPPTPTFFLLFSISPPSILFFFFSFLFLSSHTFFRLRPWLCAAHCGSE